MLDIAPSEFLLVAFVALVVIGPKDLPKAMRLVGYWVGKARGVARQFRSGFDEMVRESELAEMEKKWAEENARIMREHPAQPTSIVEGGIDGPSAIDTPALSPPESSLPASSSSPASPSAADGAHHSTSTQSALPFDSDVHPVMVEKPVVVPAEDQDGGKATDDTPKAPS